MIGIEPNSQMLAQARNRDQNADYRRDLPKKPDWPQARLVQLCAANPSIGSILGERLRSFAES